MHHTRHIIRKSDLPSCVVIIAYCVGVNRKVTRYNILLKDFNENSIAIVVDGVRLLLLLCTPTTKSCRTRDIRSGPSAASQVAVWPSVLQDFDRLKVLKLFILAFYVFVRVFGLKLTFRKSRMTFVSYVFRVYLLRSTRRLAAVQNIIVRTV